MGLRYGCKCGNAVEMNQLTTMSGGMCAKCAAYGQQDSMAAQQNAAFKGRPIFQAQHEAVEKEVFGETIREQLAIGSNAGDKGEQS